MLIKAIVTYSPCPYVPLHTPVEIDLDRNFLPYAIHRIDNGAGTYLSSKWQRKNTCFIAMNE